MSRWEVDPSGRHRLRYRAASEWTAWVVDYDGIERDAEWPGAPAPDTVEAPVEHRPGPAAESAVVRPLRDMPVRTWLLLAAMWTVGGAALGWLTYWVVGLGDLSGLGCFDEDTYKEYRRCMDDTRSATWVTAGIVVIAGVAVLALLSRTIIRSWRRNAA